MSGIDSLTACVTSFERPERLSACLKSIEAAGIKNVTLSNPSRDQDYGCNQSWMVAAYRATTKRVLLIHDDDSLDPAFGDAYETVIGPCLDRRDAGFASWNAEVLYDDGRKEPAPYWQGPSSVMPSTHFLKTLGVMGQLTYSPCVSVFNRAVLIRACKEAEETLTLNASLERPGMILGTEILVYMRHCQAFKRWLHLDRVLSYYGSHEGSGTVKHQAANTERIMIAGYDIARAQGLCRPPEPTPRIIFVHSAYTPKDPDVRHAQAAAQESWKWHFQTGDMIDLPHVSDKMPTIRAVLDHGCAHALPEDIVVYANADAGMTTHAFERIVAGVARGRGVTCIGNHTVAKSFTNPVKNLTNLKQPGGIEMVAVSPAWWRLHRDKMPDMYIGREAWDSVFSVLAEEWADGHALSDVSAADLWRTSKAHTPNVCWHKEHMSQWQQERLGMGGTQEHNRALARAFFKERGHSKALEMLK